MGAFDEYLSGPVDTGPFDAYLKENTTSLWREAGAGLGRGFLARAPEMAGKGAQFLGKAPQGDEVRGNLLYEIGQSLRNVGEMYGESETLKAKPEGHGAIGRAIAEGAEMIGPSVSAMPLALIPGMQGFAGLGVISTLSGGLFGLSQAQDTLERGEAAGLSHDDALSAALKTGAIEGLGETAGTFFLGKFFGAVGGKIAQAAGKSGPAGVFEAYSNPAVLKEFGKGLAKTYGVEIGTEIGQNAGEAAVERAAGIPGPAPTEAGLAAIGPTAAMTTMLAPFGVRANIRQARNTSIITQVAQDPAVAPELRNLAVGNISASLKEVDPEFASKWSDYAFRQVLRGQPVVLSENIEQSPLSRALSTAEIVQDISWATDADEAIQAAARAVPGIQDAFARAEAEKVAQEDIIARRGGDPEEMARLAQQDAEIRAVSIVERIQEHDAKGLTTPTAIAYRAALVRRLNAFGFEAPQGETDASQIREDAGQVRQGREEGQPGVQPGAVEGGGNLQLPAQAGAEAGNEQRGPDLRGDEAVATVDAAAHEAATSKKNNLPEPTEAQKEAGNYPKGHANVGGLDISIENPAGSKRRPEWPTLKQHYGYVKGVPARAPDKEHVDVFVKPGTPENYAGNVYVVDQNRADGKFDEPKIMVGFASQQEATGAYLENYTKGWKTRVRGVTPMPFEQFKAELQDAEAFRKPHVVRAAEAPITRPAPEAVRADLQSMAGEAGWAERGGKLIRSGEGASQEEIAAGRAGEVGPVVGRTKWVPNQEWFQRMRQDLGNKGLIGKGEIQAAADAWLAGKKIGQRARRTVDWMLQEIEAERDAWAEEHQTEIERDVTVEDLSEAGIELAGQEMAINDLMALALGKDEAATERAAIQYEGDDNGLIEALKAILEPAQARAGEEDRGAQVGEEGEKINGPSRIESDQQETAGPRGQAEISVRQEAVSRVAPETKQEQAPTPEARPALELEQPTPAELLHREQLAAARAQREAAEAQKSLIDEQRAAFQLTGSNRAADVAAAAGQQDLLVTMPRFGSGAVDTLSTAELELRDLAHAKKLPGDVMLGNGQFVPLADAVRLAKEGIDSGAIRPFPAQINFKLDIAMRDVDRVLAAAQKQEDEQEPKFSRASSVRVDPSRLSMEVLSRMDRTLKAMDYDSRGAEDVREALQYKIAPDGVITHPDWIDAYEKATESRARRLERKERVDLQKEQATNVDWDRVRALGQTRDLREAGFIAPAGQFIDLSGKAEGGEAGTRGLDHREVGGTAGMQEFMALGNIRMDLNAGTLDIAKEPTTSQYRKIAEFSERKNGEVVIDLDEGLGDLRGDYYLKPERTFSREYPEGTRPARILADIRRFYSGQEPVALAPKFARGTRASGITIPQLRTVLSEAFGAKVADRLLARVMVPLETQAALPAHVVPYVKKGDTVYGFYDPKTDKTYVVLENLTQDMVRGLTMHEVGVHYGMERMLGAARFKEVVHQMKGMRGAGNKAVVDAYAQAGKESTRLVDEEAIAYMVGNHPKMPFVRRVIAAIKAFMFREFGIGKLTPDDISALARAAVTRAVEGPTLVTEAQFSRQSAPVYTTDPSGAPLLSGSQAAIIEPILFKEEMDGTRIYNYGIHRNGEVVGEVSLGWKDGKVRSLYWIGTEPEFRRQGIAEDIVGAILDHNGDQELHINQVLPAARKFWKDLGAEILGDEYGNDGFISKQTYAAARAGRDQAGIAGTRERIAGEGIVGEGDGGPGAAGEGPRFSRANAEAVAFPAARQVFNDLTTSDRALNRVISRFNTPFHIAKVRPEFAPVYEEAQDFTNDVSRITNESADQAQDLLPRIENFKDFGRKAPTTKAVQKTADALYAGTLWGNGSPLEGRVWSDEELRQGRAKDGDVWTPAGFAPLSEVEIKLYRQALAAVSHSVTEHSKALIWRLAKIEKIDLQKGYDLADTAQLARDRADSEIDDRSVRLELLNDPTYIEDMAGNAYDQAGGDREGERAASAEKLAMEKEADQLQKEVDELEAFKRDVTDIEEKTNGLIDHGYFPSMRFGKYFVNAAKQKQDGTWTELYFGRYETQAAANAAKREVRAEFPGASVDSGVMNDDAHKLFAGLNTDALELFAKHMRDENGEPIDADPLMQQYFRIATADRSTLKRQIHRKGIAGFSKDVPRALAQFVVSNATAASRAYHAAGMKEKALAIKAGDLQQYATRYVAYLQDPQEEAHFIRSVLANYYILGTLAFGAVNMTQPVLMSAPMLSHTTSWVNAMAELGKAAKDVVTGRRGLSEEEKSAYERASKAGVVSPQEIHQIRAEGRASMLGDSPGWQKLESIAESYGMRLPGKLLMRKISFLWGSIYSMTEQFNRGTTFLAAYRIAKAKGMDSPYEFAVDAVNQTQGVYSRSNRPVVSRGMIGAPIMTFKQFGISYLELAKRLYTDDKKAFAVMMLTMMVLAGLEGLPFAEDIEDLIDSIGQWLGYGTNSKKKLRQLAAETLGKDIGDVLLHGFSAIPGMPLDVSMRLGMQNVIPGTAALKTSEADKTRDVLEVLGPAASIARNAATAGQALATGDPGKLHLLLPKGLQDLRKGLEMARTGEYRDTSGRKVVETDLADAMVKVVGFQPAGVARKSRVAYQEQQDIAMQRVVESAIAGLWARGIADREPEAVVEAREMLRQWNADNPSMPVRINQAQLVRRVREMRATREERLTRATPLEMRAGVRQELRQ